MKLKSLMIGMKMKIIDDNWDDYLGIASVTVAGKFGEATGEAMCSIEDCDNDLQSKWLGYEIANYRALTNYEKLRRKALYQRWKGIERALDYLTSKLAQLPADTANEKDAIYFAGYANAIEDLSHIKAITKKEYTSSKNSFSKMYDTESDFIGYLLEEEKKDRETYRKIKEQKGV